MIRPEFTNKPIITDRVQALRNEAKTARRARIAKALKR